MTMVNFLMTTSSLEKVTSPFCAGNVSRVIIPESVSNFRYTITSQCVFILSASGQFGI